MAGREARRVRELVGRPKDDDDLGFDATETGEELRRHAAASGASKAGDQG